MVKMCGERLASKREIKFTKSCRSRRNPLKSSKLQQIEANRFFLHFSLFVCNLSELSSICTTFLLRSNGRAERAEPADLLSVAAADCNTAR